MSDHSFNGYSGLTIETTPNSHLIYSITLSKDQVICTDEAKRTADILSSNLKRSHTTSLDGTWDTYRFKIKDKRVFVKIMYKREKTIGIVLQTSKK